MSYPLPSIGIDFGTSSCCMAWVPPGSQVAEVIRNAEGRDTTPTVLYYGDELEPLVGEPAAEMAAQEDDGYKAIHSIKRDLLQARPFRVGGRSIQPVDAAATILGKLRRDAEQGVFRGQPLTRTVLTHPARFDVLQRDKLKEAANQAGFTEVLLLPEPVAAALAYERWLAQTGSSVAPGDHILVYDFGGGTFDLAVLAREVDGTFREALVPEGLSHLGGNDLDTALASHVEDRAIDETGRSFGTDHDFGYPTIRAARDWKERLTASQRVTASVNLPGTSDTPGTRYSTQLTREEFETLVDERFIAPTIRLTLETFARAASLAGSPDRVGVVLIGGGTRVPLIEQRLREVLPVTPHAWDRRDLAVALGAAWHGHRVWTNALPTSTPPPPTTSETRPAPSESRGTFEPTPSALEPFEQSAVETPHPEPMQVPAHIDQDTGSVTIVVDAEGNGDYNSVAEAVAAGPSGATIRIRKGTYNGSIVLDKPVNLIGDGDPGDIILEAQDRNVITSTAPSGLVQNLHIRQTGGEEGSCIEIASGELTVEDCDITSLSKSPARAIDTGAGIDVHHNANPTVRRCRVHECRQHGVWVHDGGAGLFEDNDILANWIPGVGISAGGNPIFRGNRIHNGQGAGCYFFEQARGTLEDNDIFANSGTGISITAESDPVIRNNRIYDNGLAGINVLDQGRGMLEQNDILENKGNGIEISSRANPVAQTNRIRGNLKHGVSVSNNGRGSTLDNDIFQSGESGVWIDSDSDPLVRENRIHGNGTCGIYVRGAGTNGIVESNDIHENGSYGILVERESKPTIRGNRVFDHDSHGVMFSNKSHGPFERNIIENNNIGVIINMGSFPRISKNIIRKNRAHGVAFTTTGSSHIDDNDIVGNGKSGIHIELNGDPRATRNRINQNGSFAVEVSVGGSGTFEDNDLRDNSKGAWNIFFMRRWNVKRSGNLE